MMVARTLTDANIREAGGQPHTEPVMTPCGAMQLDLLCPGYLPEVSEAKRSLARVKTRVVRSGSRRMEAAKPEGFQSAIAVRGQDGVYRWYVPLQPEEAEARRLSVQEILRARKRAMSPGELSRLTGIGKLTIIRDIHAGHFPEGEVLRSGRNFKISAVAARWYVEWRTFRANE